MATVVRVTEIERFALHDGPGIRTVVFLQGCPLFCPWCANPESQVIKKQLMYVKKKCAACKTCLAHCPQKAIDFAGNTLVFNRGLCGECQICGDLCPHNAIRFAGINRTIAEIIAEVMKDMEYYQESNGGLTISGGEPFVQYEGFLTLIRESKQQGLHIAVETTGHVDMAKMVEAEPYIDLFLFDLKHTDRRVLKEVTGAELDKVLKNLEYIAAQSPAKLILRIPVIPTFNDNGETLRQMFALAVQYQVKEVHLLPYHTLGKNKYNQIGKKYNFIDGNIDKKLLNTFLDAAETKGLTIVIGG